MHFFSLRCVLYRLLITMISGAFSDSICNSSVLFSPNSALCKSDTCAILKPENESGIWLPEMVTLLAINAVLPHIVHITKHDNNMAAHRGAKTLSDNLFLIFPLSYLRDKHLITNTCWRLSYIPNMQIPA